MSDGFPELFNDTQETFGYSRVKELIAEAGSKTPQEMIEYFSKMGEQWAKGRPQDDDITFVVLRIT